jgi:hypothetical protein
MAARANHYYPCCYTNLPQPSTTVAAVISVLVLHLCPGAHLLQCPHGGACQPVLLPAATRTCRPINCCCSVSRCPSTSVPPWRRVPTSTTACCYENLPSHQLLLLRFQVPIYFSAPMAARANQYYRLLLNWASERVKQGPTGTRAAGFGFSRVQQWQPELLHQPVSAATSCEHPYTSRDLRALLEICRLLWPEKALQVSLSSGHSIRVHPVPLVDL